MNHEPHAPSLSCADARASASAWIDGELEEPADFEVHLARCGECREHADRLRRLSASLALLPSAPDETDLWPEIARRVAERRAAPKRAPRLAVRLVAAGIGFAGTLAILRALTGVERAPSAGSDWALALRGPDASPEPLAAVPERRLLAALDRRLEEDR